MKLQPKILTTLFAAIIFLTSYSYTKAEEKKELEVYHYANNVAEYSIGLPEAPNVITIWSDEKNIPYLDEVTSKGTLGERAHFRKIDTKTDEIFDVTILLLKAKKDFLNSLTEEKTKNLLKEDYKGIILDSKKISHSVGGDPDLRRTTFEGFAVDRENNPLYYVTHFLTGKQSITVIKVQYSLENETFTKYYQMIINNINYLQP